MAFELQISPRTGKITFLHFITFISFISVCVAGPQPPQQPGAPPQGQQQNPQQGGPQSLPLSISGATAPLVSYPIMTRDLRPVLQTSLSHWSPCSFLLVCLYYCVQWTTERFFFFLVSNILSPLVHSCHILLSIDWGCFSWGTVWTSHSCMNQTLKCLGRTHTALYSHTLVLLHSYTFQQSQQTLSFTMSIAVTRANAVIRLCVIPATRKCASRCHGELPPGDGGCLI